MVKLNGEFYVLGGQHFDDVKTEFLNSVEKLTADGWIALPSMITSRSQFSATTIKDGIYAVGGFSAQGVLASPFIEFFKPQNGTWQELKTSFIQRAGQQSICSEHDKLVIFGGHDSEEVIQKV